MRQRAVSSSSQEALGQRQQKVRPVPPPLSTSASTPSLPAINKLSPEKSAAGLLSTEKICSKKWTTEQRRLLHQQRERAWLQRKAKHRCLDFSDAERAALRRYFDALAEGRPRIRSDKLENMLISLGLAETREEVADIVDKVDGDGSRELDFEEYLEMVRTRADSDIFLVFKAMMEGTLGDQNLDFQTVISSYRRTLILDATGARRVSGEQQELGYKILNNFASLQRSRHSEAAAAIEAKGESPTSASLMAASTTLPFDNNGQRWMGGPLGIMWRGVCHEERLVSSRPSSVEGKSKSRRTLQRPMSPKEVVQGIVKVKTSMRMQSRRGTVIIGAPELEGLVGKDEALLE
mmetsp:Transcript_56893/g.166607  ORF Transcript_56893/g.166607 Transcript_56893/m.166607 type:complete len:349 (+) Transcript_56893:224-1270(+)